MPKRKRQWVVSKSKKAVDVRSSSLPVHDAQTLTADYAEFLNSIKSQIRSARIAAA